MSSVAIYYKMDAEQNSDEVIKKIERIIQQIDEGVAGVYIDAYNQFDELINLISTDLSVINTLYLNKELEHDFDRKIINELARSQRFSIVYFHEIDGGF